MGKENFKDRNVQMHKNKKINMAFQKASKVNNKSGKRKIKRPVYRQHLIVEQFSKFERL